MYPRLFFFIAQVVSIDIFDKVGPYEVITPLPATHLFVGHL